MELCVKTIVFYHKSDRDRPMCQTHCVLPQMRPRPAIPLAFWRGDPHDLRSLCTKVERGSVRFSNAAHDLREERCIRALRNLAVEHWRDVCKPYQLFSLTNCVLPQNHGIVCQNHSVLPQKRPRPANVSNPLCFTTNATATGHSACILEG